MRYVYPNELNHQLVFYALGYEWTKEPSAVSFAEDFIMDLIDVDKESIPKKLLDEVVNKSRKLLPGRRFSSE